MEKSAEENVARERAGTKEKRSASSTKNAEAQREKFNSR